MERKDRGCSIADCTRVRYLRTLCQRHYEDAKLAGTVPVPNCPVIGCDQPMGIKRNGYVWGKCDKHRQAPIGSRRPTSEGYTKIKTPTGWILEHRLVMTEHLGRDLAPGENVHHINGDRTDNNIGNLELWLSPQPYGQRVVDLVEYVATYHRDALSIRLAA